MLHRPPGPPSSHTAWATIAVLLAVAVVLIIASPAGAEPGPGSGSTTTSLVLQGEVKTQVDSLQGKADAVQREIDRLDGDLEMLSESYNEVNVKLEQTNQDLTSLRRRLKDTRALSEFRRAKVDERLVASYKAGTNSFLEILLATDDFSSFVKRLILLYHVSVQDRELAADVADSVDRLNEIAQQIDATKREEVALREELEQTRSQIETTLASRQATLAGLDDRIAALIQAERVRQDEEQRRLEEALRARMAQAQVYSGPLPQTGDAVLDQVIETAARYLGVPYVWAGERPSTGMDCSGFTRYVFAQHGIQLPHYSGFQAQLGVEVPRDSIRSGDLVAFGSPVHHVGIYIGEGRYIHSPRTGDVIRVALLADRAPPTAIRRFPLQPRIGPPAID